MSETPSLILRILCAPDFVHNLFHPPIHDHAHACTVTTCPITPDGPLQRFKFTPENSHCLYAGKPAAPPPAKIMHMSKLPRGLESMAGMPSLKAAQRRANSIRLAWEKDLQMK